MTAFKKPQPGTDKVKGFKAGLRVCVLRHGQGWAEPEDGKTCCDRRHGHIGLSKAAAMVVDGKMEWVEGAVQGSDQAVWIPVARFVLPRVWRKRMSLGLGAPVATMQLVA